MNDIESPIYVITRKGDKELLDLSKITARLDILINNFTKIRNVCSQRVMLKTIEGLTDITTTTEIDEYSARVCADFSTGNPYYLELAGRIVVDSHQKNTVKSFYDKMLMLYLNKDNNVTNSLVCKRFIDFVEIFQDQIESFIDYKRDFLMDYFGFKTFIQQYSMKINDKAIERPQDMFMRTSIAINLPNLLKLNIVYDNELILDNIKETYDALSNKLYTHASPTYYNAGTSNPQYASCFLMGTDDSAEGIMKTMNDSALISKWAGGIGLHVSNWRSCGSKIRGTNGRSAGITPFLRIMDATMMAFNQGGRRKGSAKIYLMPHHPDILTFISLKLDSGLEEQRVRNLFYAVWIPDIFMQRVEADEIWSLFDPDTSVDLSNVTNYTEKYLELEKQKLYIRQLPARTIWKAIADANAEKGIPDIMFSDNVNRVSQHSNIGVIKSSNLCNEIVQYSDSKMYATCVLSSIPLNNFVTYSNVSSDLTSNVPSNVSSNLEANVTPLTNVLVPSYDFQSLISTTKLVVRNLNKLIDTTYHPLNETRLGCTIQRAIGVGVQGLDDAYAKMRFAFDSPNAINLNKIIFECIYYAALSESAREARKLYKTIKAKCKEEGKISVQMWNSNLTTYTQEFTNPEDIPTDIGAYPAYKWNGGCDLSKGKFHWEYYLDKSQLNTQVKLDWDTLRDFIKKFGVRNSMVTALMPTASTSQLLGNNECFEPYTSNIYIRSTSAGDFQVIKKQLIYDLYNENLWSNDLRKMLIATEGSIQIDGIPEFIRNLYKTAVELGPEIIIQQAIDRQPFIDQAQSMNLYIRKFDYKQFEQLMFMAWKGGLKTGKYYLHQSRASSPAKFTIDPKLQKEMELLYSQSKNTISQIGQIGSVAICDVCSA